MLIPNDTLVLVGGGRKALFLRNKGGAGHPDLFTERVMEQSNPPTREQGTDRPGRFNGPDGVSKSAVENTDWHRQAEERFATDVAAVLYKKAHEHEFVHLIIVAPPRTLGTMRGAFRKEVVQKITAEVPKDLTTHALRDIARLLTLEKTGRE
jgi:protein required for attachment to host cells